MVSNIKICMLLLYFIDTRNIPEMKYNRTLKLLSFTLLYDSVETSSFWILLLFYKTANRWRAQRLNLSISMLMYTINEMPLPPQPFGLRSFLLSMLGTRPYSPRCRRQLNSQLHPQRTQSHCSEKILLHLSLA